MTRSIEARLGAGAVALAVVALAVDYFLGGADLDDVGADADDVAGFAVGAAISVAAALLLFGRLIPRLRTAPAVGNRPARVGLVTSILAALSAFVAWLGLPYVLAPAAVLMGRMGRERAAHEGGSGRATAAMVIGAAAFLLAVVAIFSDTA